MTDESPQSVVRRFNTRLRDLFVEPCAIVDGQGVLHSVNLGFCERVGMVREAVEGRALDELSPWSRRPVAVTRFIDHVLASGTEPVHAVLDPTSGLIAPMLGDLPHIAHTGMVEPLVAGRVAPGLVAIVLHPSEVVGAAARWPTETSETALSALRDAVSIARSLIALSMAPHQSVADELDPPVLARLGLVLEVVKFIEMADGWCELGDLVDIVLRSLGYAAGGMAFTGARVVLEPQPALVIALVLYDVLQCFRTPKPGMSLPPLSLSWHQGGDEAAASELTVTASGLAVDDGEALQHGRFAEAVVTVLGGTIERHRAAQRLRVVMHFRLDVL